ncbi:MAG: DNA replication and repair protein RecF [Bacteroidales bacterium]|nr:DNA replication and repair protein RecF [Bacteroidales bacterium]
MPVLKKIVVRNWRNISLQELEFSPNLNCLSGGNGEGKTNLLDAIYYLSMTKSAFGASDKYNYTRGSSFFELAGTYEMHDGLQARFGIRTAEGEEKKVTRDGKAYEKISDHIGALPIVMVCPGDSSLVSDSSDERRRFSNAVLAQIDREFLADMQRYNKLIQTRNVVLKGGCDDSILDTIDTRLAEWGSRIYQKRRAFVEAIEPQVGKFYQMLSGGRETVGIKYRSDLDKGSLYDLLKENLAKDRLLGFTSCGIQRDDLIFTMNGDPIRKVGSQGQQKSFLISLKFAQYEIMKEKYGFAPMLLLDDLFDKLDFDRTRNLLEMVASKDFGQIFITDTDKSRLETIIAGITEESTFYQTCGGVFTRQ